TDQYPDPGTQVAPGSTVTVSLGPKMLPYSAKVSKVPNLVGLTLARAREALRSAGLELEGQAKAPTSAVVRSQGTPAGKVVPRGARLKVVLEVKVPNVVGKTCSEAKQILEALQLHVEARGGASPQARVTRQTPAAGADLVLGGKATVVLMV